MSFSIRKNSTCALAVAILMGSTTIRADFSVANTLKTIDSHAYITSAAIFGAISLAAGTYAYRTARNNKKQEQKAVRALEKDAEAIVAAWQQQNPNPETAIETPEYQAARAFLSATPDEKLRLYEVGLRISSVLSGMGAGALATGTYLFGRKAVPFVISLFRKKEQTATNPAIAPVTTPSPETPQHKPAEAATPSATQPQPVARTAEAAQEQQATQDADPDFFWWRPSTLSLESIKVYLKKTLENQTDPLDPLFDAVHPH